MLFLHWNAQELPVDPTPQGSHALRPSISCTLSKKCKRFLINGAPSHPLPTGTLEQSYATGLYWTKFRVTAVYVIRTFTTYILPGISCKFVFGHNVIFSTFHDFSIFKDFHDFSRPRNQSFKFHDFSRFSMTAWTLLIAPYSQGFFL